MNRKTLTHLLTLVAGILISCLSATAQSIKMYEPEWKKIDSLAARGLTKTALAEVKKIYDKAKKEGQDAQVIKHC